MQNEPTPRERSHTPGLFWPIVFIGVGVIWLLSNLGYLPADPWPLVLRMWPVLLILIGLDVLLGRRSVLGSILGAVLGLLVVGGIVLALLYAPYIPALRDANYNIPWPVVFQQREPRTEQVVRPLEGARSAEVRLRLSDYETRLRALEASDNLIQGTVTHAGNLEVSYSGAGDRKRLEVRMSGGGPRRGPAMRMEEFADLALNPAVEYNLSVNASDGPATLDLTGLTLRSLNVDASNGPLTVVLPERGGYEFRLEASNGPVNIALPREIAVRLEYEKGNGPLAPGPLRQVQSNGKRTVYESTNFNPSGQFISIRVDGSNGPVTFR